VVQIVQSISTAATDTTNTFARVVKKVDETIQSDTAVSVDAELSIALLADKTYSFLELIVMQSDATADIKTQHAIPTGATGIQNGANLTGNPDSTDSVTILRSLGTDGNVQIMMRTGKIVMSSTAGNFTFNWSQLTSQAIDTTVFAGSYLVVWEETE